MAVDFQRQIFVLKHEVTHQLLGRWSGMLPVWLNEGFAECMAATPYTRGRYSFHNLDGAMRDYVLKWRATRDSRDLLVIPPARLMAMTPPQWRDEVLPSRRIRSTIPQRCSRTGSGTTMGKAMASLPHTSMRCGAMCRWKRRRPSTCSGTARGRV